MISGAARRFCRAVGAKSFMHVTQCPNECKYSLMIQIFSILHLVCFIFSVQICISVLSLLLGKRKV